MSPYDDGYGIAIAAALFAGLFMLVIAAAFYVLSAIFLAKIFEKAGVQGKWRAWVPVYNFMVFAKLGDVTPWAVLIAMAASLLLGQIPVLGFIAGLLPLAVLAISGWRVGQKAAGKDWTLLLLWIIPLVGTVIWLAIIAADKRPWNPNIGPSPWASSLLADKTVWAGIPVQPDQGVGGAAVTGYQAPPAGYQAPPAGYQAPPAGYQAPGAYVPPPAPGAAVPPPAAAYPPPADVPVAPPAATPVTPPPAADAAPPVPPVSTEPPAAPSTDTPPDAPRV